MVCGIASASKVLDKGAAKPYGEWVGDALFIVPSALASSMAAVKTLTLAIAILPAKQAIQDPLPSPLA